MPDTTNLVLVLVAILAGLAILALALWAFKALFSGESGATGFLRSRDRRLGIVESYTLDAKRKLMLVRRDDKEYLLMIGGPVDLLLESGIARPQAPQERPPLEAVTPEPISPRPDTETLELE